MRVKDTAALDAILARPGYGVRDQSARTAQPVPAEPRAKFGNEKTDGYASKREAKRAGELDLLVQAREISELQQQVRFELIPAQYVDGKCVERACTYTADFTYRNAAGELVVEDVKGYPNDRWAIKRKLMRHVLGIVVLET